MNPKLKDGIRSFVKGGGAYVGYCAGGFFATEKIGTLNEAGLGLIVGRTKVYKKVSGSAAVIDMSWNGSRRQVYWEGGPYFSLPPTGAGIDVTATYPDGSAASIRAPYGLGRVYVTGLHPEAPQKWFDFYHLKDTDGLDYELAVEMIHWATQGWSAPF